MSIQKNQLVLLMITLCVSMFSWSAVREYHLNIDEKIVNVTGKPVKKITVNGQFPAPILEFEEGDEAVIHVQNHLKNQDTSIHWHGLLLPGLMDGVPGFNQFKGIKPNEEFVYRFKVRQNGTYWYHAHSKGQEQDGLYGSLIIYPKNKKPLVEHEITDRDYIVMLSDFHESGSAQIFSNLKKSAEYYQNQRETVFDVLKQIKQNGFKNTWKERSMWNQMRMLRTDLSDVTGYTFLVNGKTPEQNWMGSFKHGEKVRLRFINASAMSFFDIRIPNLKMTVVSADGQPVKPVSVDEFRIGTAETYDVIVEPQLDAYQIQAESIDRSGFALATLQNEQKATQHFSVPQARPRALLTMDDMGHGNMSDMDHSQMTHDQMDHSQEQMDRSQMTHEQMGHGQMKHKQMDMPTHEANKDVMSNTLQTAQVDGWANASTPVGLKALQYSDLKSLYQQKDVRTPEREMVIRLGGSMERYIWTINGKKFNEADTLQVQYGERIRLTFINDSMMAHPMHLHGMFMQLENGQNIADMPNKHTIIVPPGKTVTALLTADELGEWAIHCHLLYHMSAGMMNKLVVANVEKTTATPPLQPQERTQGGQHEHH
ncbi:copper oxidase [Acinetobacter sp. ANC 4558]|uniref:copper resistance system multicopper oxidase n=1 Tax=Acinetobacter sp. ANC 4558 TaxID=1977876 RepID=UPI000A33674B|nr:copper resistance system multicopper oxidase [Acinetobacter sp. ANC 4558]OTG85973.1 copper oxidase [Acinetobacter sp. ANC 4558]